MPRSSRGLHRLIGARQSRTIPPGSVCPLCRKAGVVDRPVTHVLLSALERHYTCTLHAEQAKTLGYEVFPGETQ
jgi:hypothetical protein